MERNESQNDNLDFKSLVSIVILNYNAGDLLLDCVDSIFKTNYEYYEVIVVDNASKDSSHKKCKEKFPKIHLIENKENLGYCEGNNVGIRHAKGDYTVILNPDTIVDPNWLKELILAYKVYGDGLYQPKFLTTSDHSILLSTGNMIQLFGFGFSRSKGELDLGQFEHNETIGYASGTCLFTSTNLLRKLEMFDSFLFAYHDDLDLGWRAALQGIKSHYVPKSIVYHPPEGFSFKWSPYKFYLLERNRQYCILTHYSRSTFYKLLPYLILIDIAVFFFYLRKGMLRLKIKASFDIIKNRHVIKQQYLKIQKNRKVNDRKIIENFSDEISVPKAVNDESSSRLFNRFIRTLSGLARRHI